jgi:hypothetical protein
MPTKSQTAVRQEVFDFQRATLGDITKIAIRGTLNETFEGRKLAASIKSHKAVVDMRDVRRFASWGMSEWMEFLRATADCDIYLVECSTYAMSQLNMVTGLLGHAKLVSFYASYRCSACSEELQALFLIPRDREAIRDIPNSLQQCPACGGRARLEEYPSAFFDAIAQRPRFDVDDEVLTYMRERLKYDLSPDLTRFRAHRRTQKDLTYLRLSGNIATLPPAVLAASTTPTLIVDLEGIVFEPDQVSNWRDYLQAALPMTKTLQLVSCPPGFLETALQPSDFNNKLRVRSFEVANECRRCNTRSKQMVDVAANLEELVTGSIPGTRCTSCHATAVVARMTPGLAAVIKALPARDRDPVLDLFLKKSRSEPTNKLENALAARSAKARAAAPATGRGVYVALSLSVLVVGALAVVATKFWNDREKPTVTTPTPVVQPPVVPQKTFVRPDWIVSSVPGSGFCQDMANRFVCIGVSSHAPSKEDGIGEATDAALEELVSSVGLKIDQTIKDKIISAYSDVRAKTLAALQAAELDRNKDAAAALAYKTLNDKVRLTRKRVVEVLRATGGAAVPAGRSDWYWEEYDRENAPGTEFLTFVRFDVSLDAVRSLVETYSSPVTVLGATTITAFPELAWAQPKFAGGAQVIKPASLAAAGVAARDIITAVGERPVVDAPTLARLVDAAPPRTELALTVAGNDSSRLVRVKR